ncbi:ribosome assembly factor SBDS [Candidatus Woesearchaeota archaeon]|nr:ribosome assembly factor SBDS [Candidatus Woesearchaeota archaeon]
MKGNKLIDDHVQISVNLVRYKTHGKTFEIAIDADKAVAYKEGDAVDIDEIINSDHVYEDMKKGLQAKEADLTEVFSTTQTKAIVQVMLEKGEIQFTQNYRTQLRERKMNKIVNLIHRNAINPKTGTPHPENRIIAAIEEAKVKVNDLKKAEDQIDAIITKLRPIIPISLETVKLRIHIPASVAGRLRSSIENFGKLTNEQWLNDGALMAELELPAGMQAELVDELNNVSHGGCTIDKIN